MDVSSAEIGQIGEKWANAYYKYLKVFSKCF